VVETLRQGDLAINVDHGDMPLADRKSDSVFCVTGPSVARNAVLGRSSDFDFPVAARRDVEKASSPL
jgi:hypothetical protein